MRAPVRRDYEAFSYGSLRQKADFSGMECEAETLFTELGTSDTTPRHLWLPKLPRTRRSSATRPRMRSHPTVQTRSAPWVAWDMAQSWSQEIHHLHGALHLSDAGDRLKKLTWIRTGVALVDQIREQLAADNDEHILDLIARGGLRRIFASVHGDPRSDETSA